jgi:hypothetical protein
MRVAVEGSDGGGSGMFPPIASLPLKSAAEKPSGGGGAAIRAGVSERSKPGGGGGGGGVRVAT